MNEAEGLPGLTIAHLTTTADIPAKEEGTTDEAQVHYTLGQIYEFSEKRQVEPHYNQGANLYREYQATV